ncbi:MAG: arsenate reductase (azurin) small subunit [Gammaproteobacteria bacterium]
MSTFTRREFLKTGGAAGAVTASAAWTAPAAAQDAAETAGATLDYPQKAVARLAELAVGQPLNFTYPDESSPCVLLRTGAPVPGGAGPDNDIVAYSALCTHMGYPVSYHAASRTFRCLVISASLIRTRPANRSVVRPPKRCRISSLPWLTTARSARSAYKVISMAA